MRNASSAPSKRDRKKKSNSKKKEELPPSYVHVSESVRCGVLQRREKKLPIRKVVKLRKKKKMTSQSKKREETRKKKSNLFSLLKSSIEKVVRRGTGQQVAGTVMREAEEAKQAREGIHHLLK